MAHFNAELPTDLIKQFETLYNSTEAMIAEMVTAGAAVAADNIRHNMPESLRRVVTPEMLKQTRVYKTPTDGGRNCGVFLAGYFVNSKGKKTPVELVANMHEYGSSSREYPKKPFMRKAFKKQDIENAMLKAQEKYIKGEAGFK